MYLENRKRTATVIYVTFAFMMAIFLFLWILFRHSFFIGIFFWWMLLALILVSRGASRALCRVEMKKRLAAEGKITYAPKRAIAFFLVILMGMPFYYVWLFVSFISCLHAYAPLVTDMPILLLSFFTFAHVVPIWRDLEEREWLFWSLHVVAYLLIRILSWILRVTVLAEFYHG